MSLTRPLTRPLTSPLTRALTAPGVGGGGAYSPASLFAQGEQGAWYDPSDFSTMFQDSAGTTPVTAVGQPVGRILDKSGRGNHATQANASNKPVLQQSGGLYYLQFDGVDDFLVTGSIDFTGTDKMTVVAGVRKNTSGTQVIAELGTNGANPGAFYFACGDVAPREWSFYAGGSTGANLLHSAHETTPAPDTAVISGTQDIAGDLGRLRRNGTYGVDSAVDKGTGNFGNHPIYIGSRSGPLLPFNGHIYQLVVRGALTADLAPIETFTADKIGITL